MAELENGKYASCFSSGMAATDTLVKTLQPGDEIISTNDLYGGTYRLFTKVYGHFGIKSTFVDLSDLNNLKAAINPSTKMLWLETPTNPLIRVINISEAVQIAHEHGITVVGGQYLCHSLFAESLRLGADIVLHSITKYIGGHSDVVMGCVIVQDEALASANPISAKFLWGCPWSTRLFSGPARHQDPSPPDAGAL